MTHSPGSTYILSYLRGESNQISSILLHHSQSYQEETEILTENDKKAQFFLFTNIPVDTHRYRSHDSTLKLTKMELIIQGLLLVIGSILHQSPGEGCYH